MPALVMRSPANSLLSQTYDQVVRAPDRVRKGARRAVGNFGIGLQRARHRFHVPVFELRRPGLGLKRGLSEDLVIAPYATALAAMIDPAAAAQNFARLARSWSRGTYGFYEALDYTSTRVPEGQGRRGRARLHGSPPGHVLVALANVLNDGVMRNRFHAEPIVQATELLLQERTPRDVLVARPRAEEVSAAAHVRELIPPARAPVHHAHDATPRTQLLSNGRYAVMLTSAGSGYSRWRESPSHAGAKTSTRDCWGQYIFLRDEQIGKCLVGRLSAHRRRTGLLRSQFLRGPRRDHPARSLADTTLEVVVSSDDDAEVRRISITNLGIRTREIQVTSYAEISLTPQAADVAHPAFSNLFVETEFVPTSARCWPHAASAPTMRPRSGSRMLSSRRRIRWRLAIRDRSRTFRRTGAHISQSHFDYRRPSALQHGWLGARSDHEPAPHGAHSAGQHGASDFFHHRCLHARRGVGSRRQVSRRRTFDRTLTLAWTQAQVQLHHLGISSDEAHLFQRLANAVIYVRSRRCAQLRTCWLAVRWTFPRLWAQGISGDLPIVLARIDDPDDVDMIRQLLRAHEYWRMKQLSADVVIINEKADILRAGSPGLAGNALVRGSQLRLSPDTGGASGKDFPASRRSDLSADSHSTSSPSRARCCSAAAAPWPNKSRVRSTRNRWTAAGARRSRPQNPPRRPLAAPILQFFNGLGGFAEDGREYVIVLSEGLRTPEPWINVIANPSFGFLVSESGSGFTWSLNSHENQLTPWSNDHVIDPPGEAIYVRDESTRRSMDAHRAADPRRNRHLHGAPRAGLQPFPARIARHRPGAAAIRSRGRSDQNFPAHSAE